MTRRFQHFPLRGRECGRAFGKGEGVTGWRRKGREKSSSGLGKSSSRFASRSAVQGPAKAEPQLHSLRSVLGRHRYSWGADLAIEWPCTPLLAPLRARCNWRFNSGVCPRPWTPSPLLSHAPLPASPPRTLGEQLPTPGAWALTEPDGKCPS